MTDRLSVKPAMQALSAKKMSIEDIVILVIEDASQKKAAIKRKNKQLKILI